MPKILRFAPQQKYGAAPCLGVQKFWAHVVAGLMLFPGQQDEKNLRSYISLGLDAIFSSALKNGLQPQEAFASLLEVVSPIFGNSQKQGMPNKLRHATAWQNYQRALRETHFHAKGKGSIAERFMRGQLAGLTPIFSAS